MHQRFLNGHATVIDRRVAVIDGDVAVIDRHAAVIDGDVAVIDRRVAVIVRTRQVVSLHAFLFRGQIMERTGMSG